LTYIYRWIANMFTLFFGLYLLDTLMAPYFYVRKLWIAIVLAILLGAINSTNRPFRGYKNNRGRAFGFFGLTALGNYLFIQIISWLGAPLTGNALAIMVAAAVLTLLAGLINHIVGFKPKKQRDVVTREHRLSDATRKRLAKPSSIRRKQRLRR
jgi:uncharacterized membrane protein YvlD (DUF360 family)